MTIDIDFYILNEIQMYISLEHVDKIAYWDIKSISYMHFKTSHIHEIWNIIVCIIVYLNGCTFNHSQGL
jgi:hypothetical protein